MRRTKEEAAQTRAAVVDAALACFDRHGIASSTLDQIAREAGVTKGAIYHHFKGKREILREIREQVSLPLLDEADTTLLQAGALPARERIERFLLGFLETLEHNERTRRALRVMQFKCEYVDDLAEELQSAVRKNRRLIRALETAYAQAAAEGSLPGGIPPALVAWETLAFLSGLMRHWLLDAGKDGIRGHARALVKCHVAGKMGPEPVSAKRGR